MNSAMSWSVKGIEPEVREAAKLAARKSGQTMGQWLKTMILDSSERSADDAGVDRFVPQRSIAQLANDPVQDRINHLEQQLTTLTQEQTDTAVGLRFGSGTGQGDVTLQRILDRIDRNEETTMRTMAVVQERVSTMAQELSEARDKPNGAAAEWHPSEPEAFERALENVVDHIESTDKETRDTLADLHRKLEVLGAELSSGPNNVEIANRKILSDVEHRLTALAHRVDQVGQVEQSQLKQEFETRLSALAEQIDRNGQDTPDDLTATIENRLTELTQRIETAEKNSEQVQTDLNAGFEKRLKHLSERLEMVGRESELTAAQVANAAVRSATDDFREIETKVQELAAQIQAPPADDAEASGSTAELLSQMSDLSRDVQQIKLEAASEQDVSSLRSMFDTLSGSIDQRFTEVSSDAALAQLEQRLAELSQRFEQPAQASEPDPKIGELEQRIHAIDAHLATVQSDAQNSDATSALSGQIAELSQRMGTAEQHYAGIQTIENSIAKLFEGMEQTRTFAREVAEQSASGMAEKLNASQNAPEASSTLTALDEGLQALRTSAATADKRNQETLEAVHDTLEKVITRLVALEQAPSDPLQDLVPAATEPAGETVLADPDAADLGDLSLPPIPPLPSPQGFTATPGSESDEDDWDGEDDEPDDAADLSDDIYNAEALESSLAEENAEPQDAASLAGLAVPVDTSKRGDFIAAARTAARVVAEDSDLNSGGSVFKRRRGKRRGKRANQSDDARNSRRRPLVLAAIVLLMIGAASAYTLVGGKRAPTKPEQASAPTETQLMAPTAETAVPSDTPTPAETPVATPNDQQSQKSDPLADNTAQVTERSDQEPLNALLPVPTQGKQSLEQVPAPDAPRSPEMAGDVPDLTTGSIKSSRRIAPDQVVTPTDPLLFGLPGIAPPKTKLPVKQTAPANTNPTTSEITGSTTASRTPAAPVKTATKTPPLSQPATPNVKNLPPPGVGPMGLRVAAAAGDPVAQFVVATKYTEGGSVKQDFRTAAQWYQKAAGRGLAPAQYRLATFYEKGKGVPQDLAAARIWYERAAEKGNRKAMHNLAVIYADGSRGTPNFSKAGIWFRQAAELGLKDSQYNLGILHERGLGVSKDLGQAYKWFALAAKQGDSDAESRMFKMESRLSQQNLIAAKLEVQNWSVKSADRVANVVTPPADGWQGPNAAANSTSLSNAELISETQNLLNKLGYHAGRADGLMGNRTREAIREFEKANNLPVSGAVTPNLLTALRLKASG